MGLKAQQRRRRDSLREQNPRCHWCGRVTLPPARFTERPHPLSATLDHVRPRKHPARREPNNNNEERTVLACWQCNQHRNYADQSGEEFVPVTMMA